MTTEHEGTRGDLRWGTIGNLLDDAAQRRGKAEAVVDLSVVPEERISFE